MESEREVLRGNSVMKRHFSNRREAIIRGDRGSRPGESENLGEIVIHDSGGAPDQPLILVLAASGSQEPS